MCGIAGFFGKRLIDTELRRRMLAALGTRGPDAHKETLWDAAFRRCEGPATAALLHTRLSIRDLREAAGQPMHNEAGDVWICYNGEVYGWEREAEKLKRGGARFNTSGDTEFILRAYEAYGLDFIEHLRGMFALAILDLRVRKLFIVRDRMGIKPLVYYHNDREFAFASTARAVLPYVPQHERRFDADAIDAFLAHRYIPAPRTIFTRIARLPAGHYASVDLDSGRLALTRYWQPRPAPHADSLADAIREAVQLRTVSDRPVGLFLSGGIDSATVGSVLADSGHNDIRAFTAGFPNHPLDESAQAARIAQHLGLTHTVLPVEPRIGDDLETIVAALDEPFADPSSFPSWYLARAATQHVKVVLGGDGGDELFAGYKRYAKHLRQRWRRNFYLPLASARPGQLPGRGAKLMDELRLPWWQAYSLRFSGMSPALRRYLQPHTNVEDVYWQAPVDTHAPLQQLLAIDMENYLPEYILRKADLCTMAHGLELRVPLLDHKLYEHVLSMPPHARFTQPPKQALAGACRACTALDLFNQPKRGFNPPIADWLRGDLRERVAGLAAPIEQLTGGQLPRVRSDALIRRFFDGHNGDAEHVLQLLILAVSLRQLNAI